MNYEQPTFAPEIERRPAKGIMPNTEGVTPLRAISIILAHGVLRLHKRQEYLDIATEQSVHGCVLTTKGETQ
jgi:hypothetical protein